MTLPKSRAPIESFGPELMALILKGSREKVQIPVETKRKGHRLQQRINMLRARMLELRRPEHKIAARMKCSLLWGAALPDFDPKKDQKHSAKNLDQRAMVVCQPHDSEFADLLKNAGVEVDESMRLEDVVTHPLSSDRGALDLLSELEKSSDEAGKRT